MTPVRVGLVFALVCVVAAWQWAAIGQSGIVMAVGPAAIPGAIVALFALMTGLYLVSAWRGQQVDEAQDPEQSALPGSGGRLLSLLGSGLLFIAGITHLGFVLPATACGMCVARAFDARLSLRSGLICSAISLALWGLFAKALGVGLGPATPFGF